MIQHRNNIITLLARLFLTNNRVFSNSQYGFKANTSTSLTLSDATNYITANLDNRHFPVGICIDLRKVFATVDK